MHRGQNHLQKTSKNLQIILELLSSKSQGISSIDKNQFYITEITRNLSFIIIIYNSIKSQIYMDNLTKYL